MRLKAQLQATEKKYHDTHLELTSLRIVQEVAAMDSAETIAAMQTRANSVAVAVAFCEHTKQLARNKEDKQTFIDGSGLEPLLAMTRRYADHCALQEEGLMALHNLYAFNVPFTHFTAMLGP